MFDTRLIMKKKISYKSNLTKRDSIKIVKE